MGETDWMLVGINFAVKGPAFFIPLTLTGELPFPAREWAAEASQGWHAAWAALFSLRLLTQIRPYRWLCNHQQPLTAAHIS